MSREKEKKKKVIDELTERLSRCSIAIAVDYRGVTAREIMQLRRQLADEGIEYRVVKNTLARFAADRAGVNQLAALLTGPVALVFCFDDVAKPSRMLREHIQSSGSPLQIKGGVLGNRLLSAEEVISMATLPSREVLLATLISRLQMPVYTLHNILAAPLRAFVSILNARIQQIEGG